MALVLRPLTGYRIFKIFTETTKTHSNLFTSWQFRSGSFKLRTLLHYIGSVVLISGSLSYAAVPLYRIFCEKLGFEGAVSGKIDTNHDMLKEKLNRKRERSVRVNFKAKTSPLLDWSFVPEQPCLNLKIGEAALCFYRAKNLSSKPIVGIATYNIVPFGAAPFFHKIQCFCFEEQVLGPGEEVEMPLFFYIDPEYDDEPELEKVDTIFLSYTFFQSNENIPEEELLAKELQDKRKQFSANNPM